MEGVITPPTGFLEYGPPGVVAFFAFLIFLGLHLHFRNTTKEDREDLREQLRVELEGDRKRFEADMTRQRDFFEARIASEKSRIDELERLVRRQFQENAALVLHIKLLEQAMIAGGLQPPYPNLAAKRILENFGAFEEEKTS